MYDWRWNKILHFSLVFPDTLIGSNCSFGQNSVVGPAVKIDNGVKVQNDISIYLVVEIEDDMFLVPLIVFTNVWWHEKFEQFLIEILSGSVGIFKH